MKATVIENSFEQGDGILRLVPTWVPRSFCIPGRRIKLHPDDYYALGSKRGGLDERWFASTTPADNGPLTGKDEGLSFVVAMDGAHEERFLLRDAVAALGGGLIGESLWEKYGKWPMFSKFFDNRDPLPHHIHHRERHAKLVGAAGKPEAYFFPTQLNNHGGTFPFTFFGLRPGTTKDEVRRALRNFCKGDNKITNLSVAYRLEPGTGWDVPPGLLHAPGSLCTYEPQAASDVFAMYQSLVADVPIGEELLWKNTPKEKLGDYDYLLDVIDWEANTDPDFAAHHFMEPKATRPAAEMEAEGYRENWVCWRDPDISAKELTILPGRTATISDRGAYGIIVLQGHGRLGAWDVESPALIRFGELTNDEFFISEEAARKGVVISNPSACDPLVMLKHFGKGCAEMNG